MTSPGGVAPGAGAPAPERAALSRELSEFLIELSIALHKHAMYPLGHPSLGPAVGRVVRRGEALLQDRPSLSLGVARNQLVIEGVATDPKHPVLAELAGRLHRHHLGAVTLSRGIEPGEVTDLLRTLAVEADRTGQPLGMGDPAKLSAWKHVRLHPMTYERLELLDRAPAVGPDTAADARSGDEATSRDARVRGAQLWIGLARAALAGQIGADEAPPTRPAVIAKAIDEHAGGEAYDQVIVGYLLQIAQELKAAGGQEALELRRRTSRLLSEMRPDTLRRLIQMGGDTAQRRQFVLDASHGMAVDAVLEVVKAAADASQHAVSSSLMRMLSKLAAHAEQGTTQARSLADHALRDQVRSLLTGWELEDPNPAGYGAALQRMSQAGPALVAPMERMHAAEPERLVQMSLEVNAVGPHIYRACAELVNSGRLSLLLDLLEQAPGTAAAELWNRAVSPDTVRWLLQHEPADFATVDRLLPRLAAQAAEPLLDALAASEVRATRRAILERLVRLGPALGQSITARLSDERWYVKRNLLTLLDLLPELPPGFSALQWLGDSDPRVRLEALKLGLKSPAERDRVIMRGLADTEHRIVRLALSAAVQGVPADAVPHVVAVVNNRTLPSDMRVPAIRLLGAGRSPQALETLLALADGGRTLLGRRRLPPKSRELLTALAALASGWGTEPRAVEVLLVAAVSSDPQIRAATDPDGAAG
ncbi:MAG TPA: hypothetical protein VKP10_16360 [Gemmatimonadales bacterium]|nr:hypothetical protein [Gemmatimonadales bacterium]